MTLSEIIDAWIKGPSEMDQIAFLYSLNSMIPADSPHLGKTMQRNGIVVAQDCSGHQVQGWCCTGTTCNPRAILPLLLGFSEKFCSCIQLSAGEAYRLWKLSDVP